MANSDVLSEKFKTRYACDEGFRRKILERVTAYRTDPEVHRLKRIRAADYFQRNKSAIYSRLKERQAKHPELKLRGAIRARVWGALKWLKDGASVLDYLPYSLQDLKLHLESRFEDWMTWENWGPATKERRTWQIDHIIPQRMFPYDSMDSPNFLLCWSLDNLRPLGAHENFQEGDRRVLFPGVSTFQDLLVYIRSIGYLNEDESVGDIFAKLSVLTASRDVLPQPNVGLSYLDRRFQHRFRSRTAGLRSFEECWNDDLEMLRAVAYLIGKGRRPTPKAVAVNVKFNCFLPAHFFPSAAAALVRMYACNGSVVDPFLGWGGRTLGAICGGASCICGTDIQQESVLGCRRIVQDMAAFRAVDSEFVHANFSDYLDSTDRRFDLLITSPPFMATEDYGSGGHETIRSWSEAIAQPLVRGALRVVKPGGYVALHGQDRRNMPVLTTLLTAFTAAGFGKVAEYRYGKTSGQSVVVFSRGPSSEIL